MKIIPLSLSDANRFVAQFHRHNKKTSGGKFAIGLLDEETKELIGVAIAGRPIARLLDNGNTLEVLRVCVKAGYKNANSKLYGRVKRIGQLMGYEKIITYTLLSEKQSSLKAIRSKVVAETVPQVWDRPDRRRENNKIYTVPKIRWEL